MIWRSDTSINTQLLLYHTLSSWQHCSVRVVSSNSLTTVWVVINFRMRTDWNSWSFLDSQLFRYILQLILAEIMINIMKTGYLSCLNIVRYFLCRLFTAVIVFCRFDVYILLICIETRSYSSNTFKITFKKPLYRCNKLHPHKESILSNNVLA